MTPTRHEYFAHLLEPPPERTSHEYDALRYALMVPMTNDRSTWLSPRAVVGIVVLAALVGAVLGFVAGRAWPW